MEQLLTLDDAERLAEAIVPPEAWGCIAGGAGDERADLVGRPAMYGLALGGAKGVTQVLGILRDEIESALALLGCRSPAEVTSAHVART